MDALEHQRLILMRGSFLCILSSRKVAVEMLNVLFTAYLIADQHSVKDIHEAMTCVSL